jgi:hypothetical protein
MHSNIVIPDGSKFVIRCFKFVIPNEVRNLHLQLYV